MAARKYATVADLEDFKAEVKADFATVRAEIRANSLNGLKPTLEAIVAEHQRQLAVRAAAKTLFGWLAEGLHLNWMGGMGVKVWYAFLGGVGFAISAKLLDGTGALHALGHLTDLLP